ncbi:MAG: DUF3696 domain-containing protein [Deltaproteobacteria bacterium]|jgi:predicted ATPase|nr:DUF3696 domain-containing protein [Deltaproteobacteria bacterium]
MINSIYVKKLGHLPEVEIKLPPLTIITGQNNTNKTLLLKAINFLCDRNIQSLSNAYFLPEHLVNILHSDTISMKLQGEINRREFFKDYFLQTIEESGKLKKIIASTPDDSPIYQPATCLISVARYQSDTGPAIFSDDDLPTYWAFGYEGEYTLNVLHRCKDIDPIPDVMRHPDHPNATSFETNLNYWLQTLSPTFYIDLQSLKKNDKEQVSLADGTANLGGAGFSQALPVVTALLLLGGAAEAEKVSPVLLLENPDSRLHPKAQTQLGLLVARAVLAGIQCVVETYSDHFFDGVRMAVASHLLSSDKVLAYFFSQSEESPLTTLTPVEVRADGGLEAAPDGFFDQSIKNAFKLAGM